MVKKEELEALFNQHGFTDFKWMNAKDIVLANWVRFHCMFGCPSYGKSCTCPPNVPSVEECRKMIYEYNDVAVFHFEKQFEKTEEIKPWIRKTTIELVKLERKVFLSGYQKSFLVSLDSCELCASCPGNRLECKNPKMSRPGADALGIDVFSTVRSIGYPIHVVKDYGEPMNRYAFLLVE